MAAINHVVDWTVEDAVAVIIEAVFEEMTVKKALFATLDAIVKPGAILATNTSRQAAYK